MKGFLKKFLITSLALGTIFTATACNNDTQNDTQTEEIPAAEKDNYAVVEVNGHLVLHDIDGAAPSSLFTNKVHFKTECCGNEIHTNLDQATIYEGKKPASYAYDIECGQEAEQ